MDTGDILCLDMKLMIINKIRDAPFVISWANPKPKVWLADTDFL